MKKIFLAVIVCFSAVQSFAVDCPVQFGEENYLDKVVAAIKSTKSCLEAADVAEACALGASGDVEIAPVAERKCGLDFWKKLSSQEKSIYGKLQSKCDVKFGKMQGTMYLSASSFCKLNVAKLYSELYTPAE